MLNPYIPLFWVKFNQQGLILAPNVSKFLGGGTQHATELDQCLHCSGHPHWCLVEGRRHQQDGELAGRR